MSSTSRTTSISRSAVAIVAALCIPLGASTPALARPADSFVPSVANQTEAPAVVAPKAGDTPADFGKTYVVPEQKVGDTPVDFPGASRAPETRPIEIVRPADPTIVSGDSPKLPLILAGLALLAALAGGAQVVTQRRKLQTP